MSSTETRNSLHQELNESAEDSNYYPDEMFCEKQLTACVAI